MINVVNIRKDFPVLTTTVYGNPLIYLDNAATTQKPECVIRTIDELYRTSNANIHRGVHFLSEKCTEKYEQAREKIRQFINAEKKSEIIFTSGTTGSINTVATSFGERFVSAGDEIILSEMEHHSNIVPWQLLCERKGAKIKIIPFDDKGILRIDLLDALINENTKIIAVTHASNVLGTINPIKQIVAKAHLYNIPVLVDGAQAAPHENVDVRDLDCDFYTFSGHKIYAPTGIGVLYGKEKMLEQMPPYQGGGDMISTVTFEKTTYAQLPLKFEAGTLNFIDAIAFGVAIDYINQTGRQNIINCEHKLLEYATQKLSAIEGLKIYGEAAEKVALVSFLLKDIHHLDTGMILDKKGIAVRTGTLCAEPLLTHFGKTGMVRASFAFYNTFDEIDVLCENLEKISLMFN
ncbi:MAG: cysteine desulfurase [Prevotellaceae bacterium]|jgi:cysteine desulfurase/selenocysteine lyase|nr:cysteine desulfurase [Prevotellaceae bacterium]